MSLFVTFSKMVVIMFAVAMGYLANKKGFFNEEVNKKMTKVVLNITLPAMILSTVMTGDGMPPVETTLSMLKVSLVFYGLEGVFTLFLPRVLGGTSKQKGVWRHSLMFPNLAFIGYPVIEALFGKSALFYATILCLPYNILTYSIGPAMLGGSSRFRVKDLCTPMMITAVISLGIALSGLQFPALVGDMFDFVGGITAPFSLLILGSVLAGMHAKEVFAQPKMWIFSAIRLFLLPAILLVILRQMNLDQVALGVAVIEMAMPVAVNGVMLCMEYDGDVDMMAQSIFVTTILSMVTIPVVAMFL
jgi:predicted permease